MSDKYNTDYLGKKGDRRKGKIKCAGIGKETWNRSNGEVLEEINYNKLINFEENSNDNTQYLNILVILSLNVVKISKGPYANFNY